MLQKRWESVPEPWAIEVEETVIERTKRVSPNLSLPSPMLWRMTAVVVAAVVMEVVEEVEIVALVEGPIRKQVCTSSGWFQSQWCESSPQSVPDKAALQESGQV